MSIHNDSNSIESSQFELNESDRLIITRNLEKIKEYAIQHLENNDLHGLGHVERVIENIKRICAVIHKDSSILEALGWLHDIGRKYEQYKGKNHAEISSELAIEILQSIGVSNEGIKYMQHAILTHSFSLNLTPKNQDAKILRDADRLDAIGAVGIFRVCTYTFERNQPLSIIIDHIDEKLLKLKNSMETEAGRAIAETRHRKVAEFREWLADELSQSDLRWK